MDGDPLGLFDHVNEGVSLAAQGAEEELKETLKAPH